MKKTVKALALALVFIISFGFVTASAKGTVLSNDKFYVELPEGFEVCTDYGDSHYYFENEYSYEGIDIIVEGNLRFPDGIKNTPENIIEERFRAFFYDVEETGFAEIKTLEKGEINGISACYIYGYIDNELYSDDIFAYILTTHETLFIVYTTLSSGTQQEGKQPAYLKDFMKTFLVNGTYYNGEKLSKAHDFSKEEHYIDALERDVLSEDYYEYNSNVDSFAAVIIFLGFAFPILFIVLIVLYVKTRKKLKEYKEFFGTIEQARSAMYQHQMQRGYQPYGNQQYYGYNINMQQPVQPYNQGGYAPQQQPQQPIQSQQSQQCTNPTQTQDFYNNINE